MKRWKIVLFITLGALILVNAGFIFVENVYIKSDDKIVVEEIKEEESTNTDITDITLEDGAENIKVNDYGEYVAYKKDGQVRIIDTKDNSVFNYEKLTNGEIVYFKWVSGEKNLLIIEKSEEDGEIYLKPVVLKAKSKEAETLVNFDRKEMKLSINNNESVENAIFSTRSSTYYIQLKNEEGKSDLYEVNVMNQLSKAMKNSYIDNMVLSPAKTKPIIESKLKIRVLGSDNSINIPGVEQYKLIGSDKNDKIYIGNEKDGKITEIYSSEVGDNNSASWEKINLNEPLSIDDIKVDYSGKVYLIYKDKGIIEESTTGVSVKYTGDIIQSYSEGVISIKDNKISKILIK